MNYRTCVYCHSKMPAYAVRCPQCTSFSDPPTPKDDSSDALYLIIFLICVFVIFRLYYYVSSI